MAALSSKAIKCIEVTEHGLKDALVTLVIVGVRAQLFLVERMPHLDASCLFAFKGMFRNAALFTDQVTLTPGPPGWC